MKFVGLSDTSLQFQGTFNISKHFVKSLKRVCFTVSKCDKIPNFEPRDPHFDVIDRFFTIKI